jgi:diguanylate cyclase (GGDEF)-like protein
MVTAGLILPVMLRLRGATAEARRRAGSLSAELAKLRRTHTAMLEDQQFLNDFLTEFPNQARSLYSNVAEREIPQAVLNIVMRSLKPAAGVVLLPAKPEVGEQDSKDRMVVAAVSPEDSAVKLGTEVSIAGGELGFVAEAKLVMTRADLAAESAVVQAEEDGKLPGFEPELLAPMVYDQDTTGLIVLAGAHRTSTDAKAALRLIAQTAAQSLTLAASYSEMKVSSELDGLTGIYNKAYLTRVLTELIYKAACAAYDRKVGSEMTRHISRLSVFLFDIDNFKNYNDTNGHVAGDKLLRQLAQLARRNTRRDDIFGRFGGEEFLLIYQHTSLAQGLAASENLRDKIAHFPFDSADRQPLGRVSVSGGVAEYPFDGVECDSLLRAADVALYRAKAQGRDRVLPATRVDEDE